MMSKTCGDQPRMTVWLSSSTIDRPWRSSSILPVMPVLMTPMSVATTKMPPRVTVSIASTNMTLPESPPIVPGSSVRSRLSQRIWMKSMPSVVELSRSVPVIQTTADTVTMTSSDRTNRPRISAIVPRAM